jgi:hypothetical protein
LKLTDVSEVCTAFIIRAMMEAVRTSETSVNFDVAMRCYVPEESKLHTRHREDLKSHTVPTITNLMMEAVTTSETSVYFYETRITRRGIPRGYHLALAAVRT